MTTVKSSALKHKKKTQKNEEKNNKVLHYHFIGACHLNEVQALPANTSKD